MIGYKKIYKCKVKKFKMILMRRKNYRIHSKEAGKL